MDEIEFLEKKIKELKNQLSFLKKKKNHEIKTANIHLKAKCNLEYIEKLSKYQKDFENGIISSVEILEKTGKTKNFFYKYTKYHNWDMASAKINRIKLKHQKIREELKKQKPIITQINNTPKLLTIKDCVKDFCRQNIKKNIETVLIFDAYSIQVKIQKQKVMVEHKPYLLQSYTKDYINELEQQYAKK